MTYVKNRLDAEAFSAYIFQPARSAMKDEVQKTANGKIKKEQEQTEAQPDGA